MRFNINRPPKHIKKEKLKEWHEAFAWTWQKVDRTDEGHAIVWFEKYMRRERHGPTMKPNDDGIYWQQYSTKTYFKKKLNGDFDITEMNDSWRGIDMGSSSESIGILKKGGPFTNDQYKRIIIGGEEVAPGINTAKFIITRKSEDEGDEL